MKNMDKQQLAKAIFKYISPPSQGWPSLSVGLNKKDEQNHPTFIRGMVDDEFRDSLVRLEKYASFATKKL